MPELSAGERFLDEFHQRVPAATPTALGAPRADGAGTGYERLLSHLSNLPRGASVLDLACGDGELLVRALQPRPELQPIGVDLCAAEVQRARARLPVRADLRCERAQTLSLTDASVDALLCHMALMLMDEVEAVVAQVRRVLRPGGIFAAVLGMGLDDTPAGRAWCAATGNAMAGDSDRPRLKFGDPRTRSAEGLQALFGLGFHGHRFEPFTATTEGSPEALWEAVQLSYDPWLAAAAARPRLREEALGAWHALAGARPLQLRWRLAHFSCRRDG